LTDDTVVSCIKEAVPNRGHHSICHPLTFVLLFTLLTSGAKVMKPAPFGYFPSFLQRRKTRHLRLWCWFVCISLHFFFVPVN